MKTPTSQAPWRELVETAPGVKQWQAWEDR